MNVSPAASQAERRFVYLLTVAQKSVQYWISAQQDGATAARTGALLAMRDVPEGVPASEVGKALDIGPSSLSGLVDRMAQAGLVTRVADPEDGRAYRLVLTARGRADRKLAVTRARALNARLTAGFTEEELAVVARWLISVRDKFPKENEQ